MVVEARLDRGAARDLRIGVVGTGSLGRHHVRILSQLENADLVGLYDADPSVARAVAEEHGTRAFESLTALADSIEAAVVAVPTVEHASIGCDLLEKGVHVLVEKPLAADLGQADLLLQAAEEQVLAVGHVEFYNPAVQRLLDLGGETGFLEIHRLAVFTPRSLDIDVVLDLMIHDIQILHALDPSPVAEVRAKGIAVLSDRIDIANARVALESGCVANLTASRVSADRVRKLRVFKPGRGYYSIDYQEQDVKGFKIRTTNGGREILPDSLPVTRSEPLKEELRAFVAVCRGEQCRLVGGADGRRALKTALQVVDVIRRTG